jgi:hypothetical protein
MGFSHKRKQRAASSAANGREARHRRESRVSEDINVLALVKGEERYIFLYDDGHKSEALRTLGRFASNPELSFSWYDAAVLSQRIRQTAMEQRAETETEAEPVAAPVPRRHSRFKLPLAE